MMSFGDDILGKLFPASPSPGAPLISEVLERSRNDKMSYQKWIEEEKHRELSQMFHLSYFLKKNKITSSTNVHIFNSRFANAISISCGTHVEAKSFQHFFDYLKDAVLELSYELVRSEREISDRIHYIETIDRHYLNFPGSFTIGDRCHQLYGNVSIEHISIDDKPSYIKLMATYQTDNSTYTEPLGFDELIRMLFDF